MNIKARKLNMTLSIVAGALLMASLPAGAQVLGGGITGAASGMLGGNFGASGMQGAGSGAGNAGLGTTDTLGSLRDRASQTAGHTRDATAGTAQSAHSTSADAAKGAKSDASSTQGNATPAPTGGDLLLGGSASAEKHAMGHNASAHGGADSATSANRSGLSNSSNSQAGLALTKDEPAPAATTPAQ